MNPVPVNLAVVEWAALECFKQQSGELSVAWLVEGWQWAVSVPPGKFWGVRRDPTAADCLLLGKIVEPRHNNGERFRWHNVRVGASVKGPWYEVPRQVDLLFTLGLESLHERLIDVDEWYRQFEEIHPFGDGNGRVGSILWNWLRGTLAEPESPPNLWVD